LLKRVIAICMPFVEENLGLVECPPPFTAKGVRVDPGIRSYENAGRKNAGASDQVTLRSRSHPQPSLVPQRKRTPRYLKKQSVRCQTSTRMRLDHTSDWSIKNERITRSRGKNTFEASEITAAIWLQVHRWSEGLGTSEACCRPYESNAKENAQSRGVVKTISGLGSHP
jgi:hypothetical protein